MRGALTFAAAMLTATDNVAVAQVIPAPKPAVAVVLKPPVAVKQMPLPMAPLSVNYDYAAVPESAPPKKFGSVLAGSISWSCDKAACRASGPSVSACAALASQIGRIAAYGRKGSGLTAEQLAECNRAAPQPVAVGATTLAKEPAAPAAAPAETPAAAPAPAAPAGASIDVAELSLVGGAVGTAAAGGAATRSIAVGELSLVGGTVGAATAGSTGTRTIDVPELSVVGR